MGSAVALVLNRAVRTWVQRLSSGRHFVVFPSATTPNVWIVRRGALVVLHVSFLLHTVT